jgi:hypothetical protein
MLETSNPLKMGTGSGNYQNQRSPKPLTMPTPPFQQTPISRLKNGDRHLAIYHVPEEFWPLSEPVPVFQ